MSHLHEYLRYLKMFFPRRGEQCPVVEFPYMGYSPPKCSCNGKYTHSIKIMIPTRMFTCPSHATSPYRLPHTCNFPCMKNYFKNKDICFINHFIGQPSDLSTLDNPPIKYFGHPPIKYVGQPSDQVLWTSSNQVRWTFSDIVDFLRYSLWKTLRYFILDILL